MHCAAPAHDVPLSLRQGTASWDEKIVFDATIEKTKDGRFLPKTLTIKIRSVRCPRETAR